jgi:ribosomal protein S18 acetylase RimI-like enzyme
MQPACATATLPEPLSRRHPERNSSASARKLDLFQRSGLFGSNVKGCTIGRAYTAADLRQAYQLVHDVYLGSGFINPDRSGMRLRIFEMTPETATFVAKLNGKVVGVLSVVEDSQELGLPADGVFNEEITDLRRRKRRVCEMTNQAVAEEFRKSAVPSELMRCAFAACLSGRYNEVAAVISPSHLGFYELLGFRQVGEQRSYSSAIDDPVIAVSADIDTFFFPKAERSETAQFIRHFFKEGNDYLARVTGWARFARERFLEPELLKQLFVHESDFLSKCSPAELRILHRRWGSKVFNAVTADTYKQGSSYILPVREGLATRLASFIRGKFGSRAPFPTEYVRQFAPLRHV